MFNALRQFDQDVFFWINTHHNNFLDQLMWWMSLSWHTYLLVFLAALVYLKKFNGKKAAELLLGCAIVVACTDLSTNLIKHRVQRFRPTHHVELKEKVRILNDYRGGQYSFFSAHAANSVGITTFIFLCLHWISRPVRLLLFIYPLLIGYSRIYLGVHYPSDVFAGTINGLFFGSIGYMVINKFFLRLNNEPTS